MEIISLYNKEAIEKLTKLESIITKLREKYGNLINPTFDDHQLAVILMPSFLQRAILPIYIDGALIQQPQFNLMTFDSYKIWGQAVDEKEYRLIGIAQGFGGLVEMTPKEFIAKLKPEMKLLKVPDEMSEANSDPAITSATQVQIAQDYKRTRDFPSTSDLIEEYVVTTRTAWDVIDDFKQMLFETFDDANWEPDGTLLTINLRDLVPSFRQNVLYLKEKFVPLVYAIDTNDHTNETPTERGQARNELFVNQMNLIEKEYLERFNDGYHKVDNFEITKRMDELSRNVENKQYITSPVIRATEYPTRMLLSDQKKNVEKHLDYAYDFVVYQA